MVPDRVVLQNSLIPRCLLAIFVIPVTAMSAVYVVSGITTHSFVQSALGAGLIYTLVTGMMALGWSSVTYDSATLVVHVPLISKTSVAWTDITSYRQGWPSNALFYDGAKTLPIPGLVPKLDLLWEECERRKIPKHSLVHKKSG
jgi:hypothetical protein